MLLDTDQPLGFKYANKEELKLAMVTISQHTQDRGQQLEWANHLKFLAPKEKTDGSQYQEHEASENDCSCVESDAIPFKDYHRHLRLTTSNETPECTHYIAVSYCWTSTAKATYNGTPYSVTRQDGTMKRPGCPESLLERVIQFARGKGICFIWIDQECIDQNDILDKTVGIQAMDLVYQRAEYSLAVLEVCITEQRHLDALEWVLDFDPSDEDPEMLADACEAIRKIMSDQWFERAWCLQESVSGCRYMTLLIRHGPGLEVSGLLVSEVEGCFEIELPQMHGIVVSALQGRIALSEQLDSTLVEQCLAVVDDWSDKMPPDLEPDSEEDMHTACDAAAALHYLAKRYNSVHSDRLAIMANLCDFDTRLDALALDDLGFDFSICALVLSVLNGDMSILIGVEDAKRTGKGGHKNRFMPSQLVGEKPFSWCLPGRAKLDPISYFDVAEDAELLRLDVNSSSLENGLDINGCLWTTHHEIDLLAFTTDFHDLWPKDQLKDLWNPNRTTTWLSDPSHKPRVDFLLRLLCELSTRGYTNLVALIWNYWRIKPRPTTKDTEEIVRYRIASFEEIIDVPTRKIRCVNPYPSSLPRSKVEHPFQSLEGQSFRFLMETVLERRGLVVARPTISDRESSAYAGIFSIQEIGAVVFTPKSNIGLKTHERYGWYPSNWPVRVEDEESEGIKTLACEASVCGIWACGEESCERVRLM